MKIAGKPDYETYPTLDRAAATAAAHRLIALKGEGAPVCDVVHREIEHFYHREARLLDEERFSEWYSLLADDLFYWMPLTENRFRRDKRPTPDPMAMALFDERKADIAVRIGRLASNLVWTEDPPTRHVYLVSGIEAYPTDIEREYEVHSCFVQYRGRSDHDEATLTGRRRDIVRRVQDRFEIVGRLILVPQSVLLTKNLSAFF